MKYDPLHSPAADRAWTQSYRGEGRPVINLEAAVIVDLDSDFLGKGRNKIEYARQMANRRDSFDVANFNRLYSIESGLSLTGLNADHRLRLRPDAMLGFVLALANELVVKARGECPCKQGSTSKTLGSHDLATFAKTYDLDFPVLDALVSDLTANKG